MNDLVALLRELQHGLAEAHAAIAELNARHERMFRYGRVTDVDPKKHRYRQVVDIDEDGKEVKSAWIPYSQVAGTRKIHSAPSVGQQMLMIAPDGEHAMAIGVPMTWHDKNPSPSDKGDEDIDLRGKTKRTQRDGSLTQEIDGVTETTTKQTRSLVIHKDEQNPAKVDDEHPWQGNKADARHTFGATKDGGFEFVVKVGDSPHHVKIHPQDGLVVTVNDGSEQLGLHPENGAFLKSAIKAVIQATKIEHLGSLKISGSIRAAGVVQSLVGVKAPIYAPGAAADPGDATDW